MDNTTRGTDKFLMDRAHELNRVVLTRDMDFLAEATARQRRGEPFSGVVYAHQLRVTIGRCVENLELLAKCSEPSEVANTVLHLPLR